jgi:hypothetical protein
VHFLEYIKSIETNNGSSRFRLDLGPIVTKRRAAFHHDDDKVGLKEALKEEDVNM